MHPSSSVAGQISAEDRQRLAFQVSTNLKYHLSEGTVIEATPALETPLAMKKMSSVVPWRTLVCHGDAQLKLKERPVWNE